MIHEEKEKCAQRRGKRRAPSTSADHLSSSNDSKSISRGRERRKRQNERTEGSVEGWKGPKERLWGAERVGVREREKGGGRIGAGELEVSASHRH